MNEQHIKEVLSDEAFVGALIKLETAEDAQKALKEKGVDVSVEELNKIREQMMKLAESDGELTLEQMDDAAGGLLLGTAFLGVALTVAGAAVGGAVVAAVRGECVATGMGTGIIGGAVAALIRW